MHTDRIPMHTHAQALQDTSSPFCLFKDEDVSGSLSRILAQSENVILFGVQGLFRGKVVGHCAGYCPYRGTSHCGIACFDSGWSELNKIVPCFCLVYVALFFEYCFFQASLLLG